MAKLKSTFTDASVEAYIASRANEQQEADCRPLACFAIRGKDLVVYLYANEPKQKALLAKVGKYKMGKSCFYFRQLADLDTSVLEKLVLGSIAEFKNTHKPLPG